ncbi:rubrerythrin-like domain-containing protein [Natronomonas marina]|nr:rubrerythrin-like domain-containing protein [Natronomonas marina]
MRPKTEESGGKVYECFDCGSRVEGSTSGRCGSCGGELCHLGRSRDL